ncbi:MAG: histidine phosphatase family protein [Alphaproteobacteria bacterium]|nr:histidine phosphatase family protein [Alphaproteobacteria bacterium]
MTGRIITVRHGLPDQDRNVRITAREYGDWWAEYDRSGLAPGQTPPPELFELAANAGTVVSSVLPRAIETASMLTRGGRNVPKDVIYVEAPLPPPPVPFLRLRPGVWGVISRSFWFWGYAPEGVETHRASWIRVARVGDRLAGLAAGGGDVMLCGHGYLNWMLDRQLRKTGWRRESHVGRNHYFSWRIYSPAPGAASVAGDAKAEAKLAAE